MPRFRDLPTVCLYRDVVDFRKSICGLATIVEQQMDLDPFADALYVFCNRHRDRLKVLDWDQTGFCLWYKRLEKACPKVNWARADLRAAPTDQRQGSRLVRLPRLRLLA